MEIVLFISSADKERVDKTPYLSQLMQLQGYLRDPASVENPTITLQLSGALGSPIADADGEQIADADGFAIGTSPRITDANYMYIPEFGRYYFISDITLNHSGLYIISARVDALMSFKEYIKQLNCFVSRNEHDFYITEQDELLPLQFRKSITEYAVAKGSLVNTELKSDFDYFDTNIILSIVTDYGEGFPRINPPANSGLPIINPEAFVGFGSNMYSLNGQMLDDLVLAVMKDDSLLSFINSLVALPFVPTRGSARNVKKGHYNPTNPNASNIVIKYDGGTQKNFQAYTVNAMSEYQVIADFVMPGWSSFIDGSPYTHYELFLPFYGYIELNFMAVAGHRLIVYYTCDFNDGAGNVYVYDMTDRKQVFSSACQIGVKISLSSTNMRELINQRNAENTNLALNILASIGTIGTGIVSENPIAIGGGALNLARSIGSYVNANANMFERASASFAGSSSALYAPFDVRLRITRSINDLSVDMDRFAHSVGRPLRQYRTLSELRGFTIAQSVHLDGIPCLSGEAETILNALSSGVIL